MANQVEGVDASSAPARLPEVSICFLNDVKQTNALAKFNVRGCSSRFRKMKGATE